MGILYFIIGIICSIAVAQIAKSRGREAILWFIFALFAWPLALILVLALPSLAEKPLSQQDKITKLFELERLKESGTIDEATYKKFRLSIMGDETMPERAIPKSEMQKAIQEKKGKDGISNSEVKIFGFICFGALALTILAIASMS